jgi:chorismate synthase
MSNSIGQALRFTLFGESHGPAIGAVLDGLPAGIAIDLAAVQAQLDRRRPGGNALATKRDESDTVEIVSGWREGMSSGGPLCFLIRNSDAHSSDYNADRPRPSHADLASWYRDGGKADMRGGGRFSGRLTAPVVAAGSIARQILLRRGIEIGAHLLRIGDIEDRPFGEPVEAQRFGALAASYLPVLDEDARARMQERIEAARASMDSVGGAIELACVGMPAGYGEPPFDGVESALSRWIFAVPGVKALEFGAGTRLARMKGSEANDPIAMAEGKPLPAANRSGGANGGLSSGAAIRLTASMRPTPSISVAQRSVSLSALSDAELVVKGRHDPCIVPRAVPVLEAACALCLLDLAAAFEGRKAFS